MGNIANSTIQDNVMKRKSMFFFFILLVFAGAARADDTFSPLPVVPPIAHDNTMNVHKIRLGKMLFFEPRLSRSKWISCATCHNPAMGFTDRIPRAIGHGMVTGPRNTPTILNAAFLKRQFWDGRAKTLEEQALGPIEASIEMNLDLPTVLERLKAIPRYNKIFKNAFPASSTAITKENLGKAIAAYERTLVTPNSPIDRYLSGDKKAISAKAERGFNKFKSLGCADCHSGPVFSDSDFHVIRVPKSTDTGLHKVTGKSEDKYKFRTPTLRNIAITYPYMNDGSIETLEEAVRFMGKEALDKSLDKDSVEEVVAFLHTLTGNRFLHTGIPKLP